VKQVAVIAAAAASLLGVAGCGGSDEPESAAVTIKAFQFMPDRLEIEAGTTVRWENLDATTHTATAGTRRRPRPETFDGSMAQGKSFSHRFARRGTYRYFCTLHSGPGMTSTVVVR
jgi:plastocyanin